MDFYSEHELKSEARFVNKLWRLDNSHQKIAIDDLKILPNGCFNIGLLIGKGALVTFKEKKYNLSEGIYLCSQVTQPVNLTLLGYSKVILIQLHAWSFSYYSENDFSNFTDDISKSESNQELFGKNIDLSSTSILEDTINLTQTHFAEIDKKQTQKKFIEQLASKIVSQKGDCKISDLTKEYDYSEKWIQKKFKKATGLTPKQFAKIIQFRDSIDKIAYDDSDSSLTSIGYESGFNDQSHFIKNFRQFVGTTPSKFDPKNFVLSFKK